MAKKMTIHVEVLKRTQRNAVLVTNGEVACWMQGRCVRSDGTLTSWGVDLISKATMTDAEARQYDDTLAMQREERAIMREFEKAEWMAQNDLPQSITIRKEHWFKGSENAFKVWTGRKTMDRYRRYVREFVYLPKSLVQAEVGGSTVTLTMPKWIARKTNWDLAKA